MNSNIYQWLEKKANLYEFDEVSITDTNLSVDTQNHLLNFLEYGYHGEMKWLEESVEKRLSPKKMWQNAESAIIFAKNYGPEQNPIGDISKIKSGNISVYARSKDYHSVMKGRLNKLPVSLFLNFRVV